LSCGDDAFLDGLSNKETLRRESFVSGNAASFIGNIPEEYDRGLGPMIFVDYAADIAQRVASHAPARVLEMAAGTGIVTRRLRDLLPESTLLTATDLNPPMLNVARGKFRSDERADFQPADATNLPFLDGAFDAVVCQFGTMFFPDKDRSYREVYRVLAPVAATCSVSGIRTGTIRLAGSRTRSSEVSFLPTHRSSIRCRSASTRSTR
jgi:ubiquinone/menaquinone biosynthesis C-methylase UbiE